MPATVLIVDDDPSFRSLVAKLLQAHGFTVAGEAADARQGRAAAHDLRPDAAVVDVRLPDGNGIELAGELARLPWSPRIIVVSTDQEFADVERPGPNGTQLPFVNKEDLPGAPLLKWLGASHGDGV
jgi:DNA-binding NarL/FixJ family response regulator